MRKKSILFHEDYLWTKRSKAEFNITMGVFDSTESCEVVGLLLMRELKFIFDIRDTGLGDDPALSR